MNWFFDALIFGFLISDLVVLIYIKRQSKLTKSKSLIILVTFLFAWGVIGYGSFIEPKQIIVKPEEITLDSTGKTIRIAVLSDIHAGPYKKENFVNEIVDTILAEHPDYVFVLGDFIYNQASDLDYLSPLNRLTDQITTYGVLGNHDYDLTGYNDEPDIELAAQVKARLLEYGVIIMENESYPLDTRALWISGTKEIWTNEGSIKNSVANRPPTTPHTIFLTHNPDIIQNVEENDKIDLLLAGHTHGGQIRLPLIGPIGAIPDELGQTYDKGWFEYESTPMYITSGIGESGPRARLFNRPEIILLTVHY